MAFFPGVAEGTINFHGSELRYYDTDSQARNRSTFFLLHGTGGSAEDSFWALLPMLATRHRVISFDFIDSSDFTLDDYAAQARAVLEAIAPGSPLHIVGYSFGAVIASVLAANFPQLVETLSLVAGWMKTEPHQLLRNDIWRSLQENDSRVSAMFSAFTTFSPQHLLSLNEEETEALVKKIEQGPDRQVKMEVNRSVDLSDVVIRIKAPTLIVQCEQDIMIPTRQSYLLFGGIHDARLAKVASGHGVMHERPSEVFTLIDQFAQAPGATSPGSIIANTHA